MADSPRNHENGLYWGEGVPSPSFAALHAVVVGIFRAAFLFPRKRSIHSCMRY